MLLPNILERVGNTPLVFLNLKDFENVNLFAKIEA